MKFELDCQLFVNMFALLKCNNVLQFQTHFLYSSLLIGGNRCPLQYVLHASFWVANLFFYSMYTTILHPLRKAYNLSLLEYCVLEEIRVLSHNHKFGGWCVKSKQNMGDSLDVSKQQIHRIINTLLSRGLIEKNGVTKYIRTTDEWNGLIADKERYKLAVKSDSGTIIGDKFVEEHNVTGSNIMLPPGEQIVTPDSNIMLHKNNNKNNKSITVEQKNILALQNCQAMKKNVGKLIKQSAQQVDYLLSVFIIEQQAKGEMGRTLGKLRSHFASWAKLNGEKYRQSAIKPRDFVEPHTRIDGKAEFDKFVKKAEEEGLPLRNIGKAS